jgi:lipopolysaccharide export system protein LptA
MRAEWRFQPTIWSGATGAHRATRRLVVSLFICCWCAFAAMGQGLSLGSLSADRPLEISADSGIEWQQDAQVYIARGNAVAKRGTNEVHADTLTAHYRKSKGAGGDVEIYRLDADGHVTIKGERQTIVGDQAVYDVGQQVGIVTGKGLKLTTATDVVTARDSLEWYDAKQIAVARGDAVAIRDAKRIRADVLTAYMTKDKSKSDESTKPTGGRTAAKPGGSAPPPEGDTASRISRVDAHGNVLVSTATDTGRGDYGVYNADSGIVTLLRNVTVTRGPNAIKGQYAVVDLNNNISRMMAAPAGPGAPPGKVEGLFVRQETASPASPGAPATTSAQRP